MNILYESLPLTISVGGEDFPIYTDFRNWIRIQDLLSDNEIDINEKEEYIFMLVKSDISSCNKENLLIELLKFLEMKDMEVEKNEESINKVDNSVNRKVFSFFHDAQYVISGFYECYGIDILDIEYMHWWKFMSLLNGINEKTELKQRIQYRSIDISKIKDKNEKSRIKRIQANLKLPQKEMTDEQIGSVFNGMF